MKVLYILDTRSKGSKYLQQAEYSDKKYEKNTDNYYN
jgi:hypothetical protein